MLADAQPVIVEPDIEPSSFQCPFELHGVHPGPLASLAILAETKSRKCRPLRELAPQDQVVASAKHEQVDILEQGLGHLDCSPGARDANLPPTVDGTWHGNHAMLQRFDVGDADPDSFRLGLRHDAHTGMAA